MSRPLAEQADGKILDRILSGAPAPGDTPQEAKLDDALSMSRTPVREAISRLEKESVIARSPNGALMIQPVALEPPPRRWW